VSGTVAVTEEAEPPVPPLVLEFAAPPPPPLPPLTVTVADRTEAGAAEVDDSTPQAAVSVQVES
jgi:hypothetical protein